MVTTIIRRLIIMIPQLFVIAAICFLLGWLMPGDFISSEFFGTEMTFEQMEQMREAMGLNNPWYQQFWDWITGIVLRGDFGMSAVHHRPVTAIIAERMVRTFWLALGQIIVSFGIAIPLGIIAGRYYRKAADNAILIYGFIGMALPALVWSILLIFFFAIRVSWFPFRGSIDATVIGTGMFNELGSYLHHLVLPVIAGSIMTGIVNIYILRSQIVEGRGSDYALTAKSKGVPEKVVFNKHILRNSLIPLAQSIGFIVLTLIGGSVFIERIFNYPGMGDLFLSSIQRQDFAVANALILIFSAASVFAVLIGDIALTLVDPRIRVK